MFLNSDFLINKYFKREIASLRSCCNVWQWLPCSMDTYDKLYYWKPLALNIEIYFDDDYCLYYVIFNEDMKCIIQSFDRFGVATSPQ